MDNHNPSIPLLVQFVLKLINHHRWICASGSSIQIFSWSREESFHEDYAEAQVFTSTAAAYRAVSGILSALHANLANHVSLVHMLIQEARHIIQNRVHANGNPADPLRLSVVLSAVTDHVRDESYYMAMAMPQPAMVQTNEAAVEALERVTVAEDDCERMSRCTICLEAFVSGTELVRMPCSHMFHGGCIVSWLKRSHYCPICRLEMPT